MTNSAKTSGTGKSGAACPICRQPVTARYRPFCSARCADIDLGRWMTGRYSLPGTTPADGPIGEPAGEPASGGEDENEA